MYIFKKSEPFNANVLYPGSHCLSFITGYNAAVQPAGAGWRFFSYHPFLMVFGFVGMMGSRYVLFSLVNTFLSIYSTTMSKSQILFRR